MDKQQDLVVGIDLGTTCSLVARIDETGRPSTLINSEGDYTTPSAVFFDRDGVVVGKEAEKIAEIEADRVVRFAKRDMGLSTIQPTIRGERFPPEVIQALILQKLKGDSEKILGPFKKAVITVPAYFDEPRRKATEDAGRLAGIDVLDILNEPTAAAIAYGYYKGFMHGNDGSASETVLVYDLGGGTFDVTLMEIAGTQLKALGTAGDVYLGGVDWTTRIADFICGEFVKQHSIDPRDDESALQSLMHEAEDAKRALTSRQSTKIVFRHDGASLRTEISRDEFELQTRDLLDRTVFTAQKVLREAKKTWDDVTQVLLVGGASRMPAVERILQDASGLNPDRSLAPDEAVVHGAAIYAALLAGNQTDRLGHIQVSNVSSHDLGVLGVETATGRNRRRLMIPRNTPLPCKSVSRFKTFRDGQTSVKVKVVEGGDASGNNATAIGKCVVTGLPPNLPQRTPVEVTFRYRANGRLLVDAFLPTVGKTAELHIERTHGLHEDEVHYWEGRIHEGLTDESAKRNSRANSDGGNSIGEVNVGQLPVDSITLGQLPVAGHVPARPHPTVAISSQPATDSEGRPNRTTEGKMTLDRRAADAQRRSQRSQFRTLASRQSSVPTPPTKTPINDDHHEDHSAVALFGFTGRGSLARRRFEEAQQDDMRRKFEARPKEPRTPNHQPEAQLDFSKEFQKSKRPKTRALVRESDRVVPEEFSTDDYWNHVYDVEAESDGADDSLDFHCDQSLDKRLASHNLIAVAEDGVRDDNFDEHNLTDANQIRDEALEEAMDLCDDSLDETLKERFGSGPSEPTSFFEDSAESTQSESVAWVRAQLEAAKLQSVSPDRPSDNCPSHKTARESPPIDDIADARGVDSHDESLSNFLGQQAIGDQNIDRPDIARVGKRRPRPRPQRQPASKAESAPALVGSSSHAPTTNKDDLPHEAWADDTADEVGDDTDPGGSIFEGAHQIVAAEEHSANREKTSRRDALIVLTANTGLHLLILLLFALIVMPRDELDERVKISSSMHELDTVAELHESQLDEPLVTEVAPMEAPAPQNVSSETPPAEIELDADVFAPSVPAVTTSNTPVLKSQPTAQQKLASQLASRENNNKQELLARYGGTAESEAAVGAGLHWLRHHQWPDGSWCFDHRCKNCDATCTQHGHMAQERIGATALALITYMGSGNTYASGEYRRNIESGLNFILSRARRVPAGLDLRAGTKQQKGMYVQGLATICLSEALAMNKRLLAEMGGESKVGNKTKRQLTNDTKKLQGATQMAVDFIVNAQSAQGGWKYLPGQFGGDTSVLGWQVMALQSARKAGIDIPNKTFVGVSKFLDFVQTEGGAFYGYEEPGSKASTTAIGLLCRMYTGWERDHDALRKGVKFLARRGPEPDNMYHNYYATQVLHHWGGTEWERWNKHMRELLVKTQRKTGHAAGSWDVADQYGQEGGRLYMTCLATMTLEVYYRHLPLYENDTQAIAAKESNRQ